MSKLLTGTVYIHIYICILLQLVSGSDSLLFHSFCPITQRERQARNESEWVDDYMGGGATVRYYGKRSPPN